MLSSTSSPQHYVDFFGSKPLAAGVGLLTHFLFASYELDAKFYLILPAWFASWVTATVALYTSGSHVYTPSEAVAISSTSFAVYFGTLFLSVVIYRAFFHRLRSVSLYSSCIL